METKILTEEQYKSLSKKLIDTFRSNHKIIPLNTLKHPHYILKKLSIYYAVIASLDDIEAFAYADTEYEAINNLCEKIINIFDDLKDDKKNLGILPQKWLKILDEVIEIR